ncbi:MAG: winged helix-turn-helix transcriptional regulator [Methanomicrobium sp.]|nr:winged helix-turn-helix transcriptional regulator [Methanomicrobium sp.]
MSEDDEIEKDELEELALFCTLNKDTVNAIIKEIKQDKRGVTITDIAEKTGLNKNTVRKYALILTSAGHIEERSCGHTKVFTISNRVGLTNLLDYVNEGIMLLDNEKNVIYKNKFFHDFLRIDDKGLKKLTDNEIFKKGILKTAITGFAEKEIELEIKKGMKINLNLRFVAVNSFDGKKLTAIFVKS